MCIFRSVPEGGVLGTFDSAENKACAGGDRHGEWEARGQREGQAVGIVSLKARSEGFGRGMLVDRVRDGKGVKA